MPLDAVHLIVAIERSFKVEFPREMLKRQSATSIEAIMTALCAVQPSLATLEEMRVAA
jgi:acyl carrier protein